MNQVKALAATAALLASVGVGCSVRAETPAAPPAAPAPGSASPLAMNAREQAGLDVMAKLGWGTNADTRALDEDLWRIINEANLGLIWSRPGLSLRDREVVSMTVLIAIGSTGVSHMYEHANDVGLTDPEIKEIILQTIPYAGQARALQAMAAFKQYQAGKKPKP
ncbi:MAG: carboxymuconolactone decarboxylase family protein [Phenylobacterium sp.]